MSPERVEYYLWLWVCWMHKGRSHHLGYPSRCAVGENYTTTTDFDAECDNMDNRLAEATDAVVDGLPPIYRTAVYAHDLGGRWTEPEEALGIVYRAAVGMVGRGLDRKGVE